MSDRTYFCGKNSCFFCYEMNRAKEERMPVKFIKDANYYRKRNRIRKQLEKYNDEVRTD